MQLRTTDAEEYADIRTANEEIGEETRIEKFSDISRLIK